MHNLKYLKRSHDLDYFQKRNFTFSELLDMGCKIIEIYLVIYIKYFIFIWNVDDLYSMISKIAQKYYYASQNVCNSNLKF